jgi:hypothetical protein
VAEHQPETVFARILRAPRKIPVYPESAE